MLTHASEEILVNAEVSVIVTQAEGSQPVAWIRTSRGLASMSVGTARAVGYTVWQMTRTPHP